MLQYFIIITLFTFSTCGFDLFLINDFVKINNFLPVILNFECVHLENN